MVLNPQCGIETFPLLMELFNGSEPKAIADGIWHGAPLNVGPQKQRAESLPSELHYGCREKQL